MQGVPEECRSLLERLGGVRGIATKLSTNVETGINADDIIERVEAYVVVAHSVSSCWGVDGFRLHSPWCGPHILASWCSVWIYAVFAQR